MSKAGRTLLLNPSQEPSALASALRQRPRPQGQSRSRTQNQRVNFHGLSDAQFDESGNFVDDDGNDDNGEDQNNQDSDGNERIQCTMTQVSDNSQLPEVPDSKDTLIINTIKQPGNCSELNAFDIRRFMSNAQPPKDSDTQTEANASYDPVPSSQNEVTPSSTGKSKSKLSRFFKKKTASAINNAFAIFALICLVRCPQVVTASVHEEKRNTNIGCHPVMLSSSVASNVTYNVSRNSHRETHSSNSMVDNGANGGIAGGNTRKVCETGRYVDVTGVDNHELNNLAICTVAGMVDLPGISFLYYFHQYAFHSDGDTIHSKVQLMDYGNKVDCDPIKLGGTQRITRPDGTVFPLDIIRSLAYLPLRRPTDDEMNTYEPIHMTSDEVWDPTKYNTAISKDADWFAALANSTQDIDDGVHRSFDRSYSQLYESSSVLSDMNHISVFGVSSTPRPIDFESMRTYFLGMPANIVNKSYTATTQFYSNFSHRPGQVHMYKSPFPAANVFRRSEGVSTDTIYADTPAWGGFTCMQIFAGADSYFLSGHECRTDGEFCRILEDEIRFRGAPNLVVSDRAKAEISRKTEEVLRRYIIDAHQSEPYQQQQNPVKRFVQDIKRYANYVHTYSGAPPESWVHIVHFVMYVMNRSARSTLNYRTRPMRSFMAKLPILVS